VNVTVTGNVLVPFIERRENWDSQLSASHFNAFSTMNVWSPQQHDLDEILSTIFESTNSTNQAVQRTITHVSSPSSVSFIIRKLLFFFLHYYRNSTASRALLTISPILPTSFPPSPSRKIVSGPSLVTFSRIMPASSSALPRRSSHSSKLPPYMHSGIRAT